jgi:hypothetical protein
MNPFEELLVSSQELDQQLVTTVLKPLLRIDKETCQIRPQQAWRGVSNRVRVLAYLLARKAMTALGLSLEREAAAPSEVSAATGIPTGSVNPTLKALYEGRPQLVDKDASSRYFVPSWAVDVVCEQIGSYLNRQGG